MLDPIRSVLPPEVRERAYVIGAAVVTFLGLWGLLDASEVAAISTLVVGTLGLVFAILYSTSKIRMALYTVLLAVQGVAQLYHVLTDSQWAAIIGLTAVVLGVGEAAAKTPTPITNGEGHQAGFSREVER